MKSSVWGNVTTNNTMNKILKFTIERIKIAARKFITPFPDATVNKIIFFLSFWFNKITTTLQFCLSFNCSFPLKTNPKLWYLLNDGSFVSCVQSDERSNARLSGVINFKNTIRTVTVPNFFRSQDISFNSIESDLTFSLTRTDKST